MRFAYDDQIASQPDAMDDVLARAEVPALDPGRAILFTGLGTSLHACRVAAAWTTELSGGAVVARAIEAHELARWLPIAAADQVVVVSHRGTKLFSGAALEKARAVGARTVAIVGEAAPEPKADHVLRTCPDERAGAHTVSYLTALTWLARIVAQVVGEPGQRLERALRGAPGQLRTILAEPPPLEQAARLARREPVLVAGFGLDAITADEVALKLKEATYVWAEGSSVELALHGPVAACRRDMGALLFVPDEDDQGRTAALDGVLRALGATVLTCGDGDHDLSFPRCDRLVRPLVGVVAAQRLVAEVARATGTDPDRIHKNDEPWKSAMTRYRL